MESHRPELMMTKMTKIAPDFSKDCPMWEETIKNATMGDAKLQEALELTLGLAVTGYTHEVFAIFYGASTDNLKSTICETVGDLLGDYSYSLQSKALQAVKGSGGESATPSIAGLKGKRLVLADEWAENTKLDEAVLKRICSQDTITARMLHSNPITFAPTHTIVLRTNDLPIVSGNDEGAWKRILPFPFKYKVPEDKKDEGFRRRMMKQEGGAILAWLCRCAMRFIELHERGGKLPRPQAVEELKRKYRAESDILARWAEAEVEFGQDFPSFTYWLSVRAIRDSFDAFAEEQGDDPKNTTPRKLSMFLGRYNCNPKKNRKGERGWSGLRLRIPDNPNEGGDGVERGAF
jgi:putative DNA primase/helicase